MKNKLLRLLLLVMYLCLSSVINAQVQAVFAADKTEGLFPFNVQFTDQSTGNPIKWNWWIDHAHVSSSKDFSYTFSTYGVQEVMLEVTDGMGLKSTYTQTIIAYGDGSSSMSPRHLRKGNINEQSSQDETWFFYEPSRDEQLNIHACEMDKTSMQVQFNFSSHIFDTIPCGEKGWQISGNVMRDSLYLFNFYFPQPNFPQLIDLNTYTEPRSSLCSYPLEINANSIIDCKDFYYTKYFDYKNYLGISETIEIRPVDGMELDSVFLYEYCDTEIRNFIKLEKIQGVFKFDSQSASTLKLALYGQVNAIEFNIQEKAGISCSKPLVANLGVNEFYNETFYQVWYEYTPTENGLLEMSTCNYGGNINFNIIDDCYSTISTGSMPCQSQTGSVLTKSVAAGKKYYILCNADPFYQHKWDLSFTIPADGEICDKPFILNEGYNLVSYETNKAFYQRINVAEYTKVTVTWPSGKPMSLNLSAGCNQNYINSTSNDSTIVFFAEPNVNYTIYINEYDATNYTISKDVYVTFEPFTPLLGQFCSLPIQANLGKNALKSIPGSAVWYKFTPTIDGFLDIQSCKNNMGTYFQVYERGCGSQSVSSLGGCSTTSMLYKAKVGKELLFKSENNTMLDSFQLTITPSYAAQILNVTSSIQTKPAVIGTDSIINLEVSYNADLSNLYVDAKYSAGAVLLDENMMQLYNSVGMNGQSTKILYVKSADSLRLAKYTLKVTKAATALKENLLLSFTAPEFKSSIIGDTVEVYIPSEGSFNAYVNFQVSPLAKLFDATDMELYQSFNMTFTPESLSYLTVKAEDGTPKVYVVKTMLEAGASCNVALNAKMGLNTGFANSNFSKWYIYKPTKDCFLNINACDPNIETVNLYSNCLQDGVSYITDFNCDKKLIVENAVAGQEYLIRINAKMGSNYIIDIQELEPPLGAICEKPIIAKVGEINTAITNNPLWYEFTSSVNGFVNISNCGSGMNMNMSFYNSCQMISNDNFVTQSCDSSYGSKYIFDVAIGQKILIQVSAYASATWNISERATEIGEVCSNSKKLLQGANFIKPQLTKEYWTSIKSPIGYAKAKLVYSSLGSPKLGNYNINVQKACNVYGLNYTRNADTVSFLMEKDVEYVINQFFYELGDSVKVSVTFEPFTPTQGQYCSVPSAVKLGENFFNKSLIGKQWFKFTALESGYYFVDPCSASGMSSNISRFNSCNDNYSSNSYSCNTAYKNYMPIAQGETLLLSADLGNTDKFMFDFISDKNTNIVELTSIQQTKPAVLIGNTYNLEVSYNVDTFVNVHCLIAPFATISVDFPHSTNIQNMFIDMTKGIVPFTIIAANGIDKKEYYLDITKATAPLAGNELIFHVGFRWCGKKIK
ncbi:MAG: PKD domain-containing protein [Bacteroidales bacterium]|nr:PKD domain-containing protein [Bacteroidales bacterium]